MQTSQAGLFDRSRFNTELRVHGEEDAARWLAMVFHAYPQFSDLDIQSELPAVVMVHGRRLEMTRSMDHNEVVHIINALYPNGWPLLQREQTGINTGYTLRLDRYGSIAKHTALDLPQRIRLRVNAVLCRDPVNPSAKSFGAQITLRTISETPPDWRKLQIPQEIVDNFFFPDGIVMVTGPTGSGKTTLMAAMFAMAIEDERFANHKIITLEAPIEFVYAHPRVSQSEVPLHIKTFERGIEEAMRRRPNVIMVGESRDRETIVASITAAMTGHQVLTTLHATGVANSVSRMIKAFPHNEASSLAADLGDALRMIISQRLLMAPDNTLQAVREWLVFTEDLRRELLQTPFHEMTNAIARMVKEDGHSFAQDAEYWYGRGRLTDTSYQWIMRSYGQ